jgi:signal peptidase II
MGGQPGRRPFWPFGLVLFATMLAIDQWTKRAVLAILPPHMSVKVAPGLWYTFVQNTGAVWGSLPDTNALFMWVSVIAFGLLLFFYDQFRTVFEKLAFTLLLAGLWGNLLDRAIFGFVIDFIDLRWWPVFNIADACISVGITLYLLDQLRKYRVERKKDI